MKKNILLLAMIFSLVSIMNAQENIRFGFQLSPSFSWMTTSSSAINPSDGPNLGLKLGMLGEYYFQENYAAVSGIGFHFNAGGTLLHNYGGNYWTQSDLPSSLDTLSNNVKLKYSIQYLEIPFGLKMRTKEFGYIRYYMTPQLTAGFKTQARGVIDDQGITGETEEKYNIKNEVTGLALSWGIGAGIEYSISESSSLVGGVLVQFGFVDATKDGGTVFHPDGNKTEDSKGLMRSISLQLGIIF